MSDTTDKDAMDEELVQQYHRSARAERISAFSMSPDLPLYDTPCATCKHARWDKPDYGLCDHPTSVAYRNRPMVVLPADRRLGYIQRHTYFSGLVCNAAWYAPKVLTEDDEVEVGRE